MSTARHSMVDKFGISNSWKQIITNQLWSSRNNNLLKPFWFDVPAIPDSFLMKESNSAEDIEVEGNMRQTDTVGGLVCD